MILLRISKNDAGQRLDKYLKRQLKGAQNGFLYKMLRKKNIVLNGSKAAGNELLSENDEVKLFFSEETYEKLRTGGAPQQTGENTDTAAYRLAYQSLNGIEIVFENDHVLLLNKPAGILSQKAKPADLSVNEWLIGYLLETGTVSGESLLSFKPSVCNRLDRNTSGLLVCGKTLVGSRCMSSMIKDKSLQKYYYTLVVGNAKPDARVRSWLYKDEKSNKVTVYRTESEIPNRFKNDAQYIDTSFRYVETFHTHDTDITLLEVQLFTGKTHQIRAQLGAMGYHVLGDRKYGNNKINALFYDMGVRNQVLHAYKLVFPKITDERFRELSERTVTCKLPAILERLLGGTNGDMEIERTSGFPSRRDD